MRWAAVGRAGPDAGNPGERSEPNGLPVAGSGVAGCAPPHTRRPADRASLFVTTERVRRRALEVQEVSCRRKGRAGPDRADARGACMRVGVGGRPCGPGSGGPGGGGAPWVADLRLMPSAATWPRRDHRISDRTSCSRSAAGEIRRLIAHLARGRRVDQTPDHLSCVVRFRARTNNAFLSVARAANPSVPGGKNVGVVVVVVAMPRRCAVRMIARYGPGLGKLRPEEM